MKRATAVSVVLALLLGVPGSSFHEACAQVVGASARAGVVATAVGAASAIRVDASPLSLPTVGSLASLPISVPVGLTAAALPVASPVSAAAAATPAKTSLPATAAARPVAAAPTVTASLTARPSASVAPGEASAEARSAEASELFDANAPRPETGSLAPVPGAESSVPVRLSAADGDSPEPGKDGVPPAAEAKKSKLPRSLWGLFWGHHIFTVFGVNFHMLSQPFLVKDALGMGTATMGLVRNIHMGSMAVVNFLPIGYLIDKTDVRVVYIATSLARAALMAAIPLLFMSGGLTFTALALIVAVNPLFQSTMIVADGAGRKAFLGSDEKLNKDAAATLGKWDSVAGMLMPLAAGWAIGALVSTSGLGGYALAYGIYAGFLLLSIPFYWKMVRDPRNPNGGEMSLREFATQTTTFMGALIASFFTPAFAIMRWSYRRFFPYERPAFPVPYGGKSLRETLAKAWAAMRWVGAEGGRLLAGAFLLPLTLPAALWRGVKSLWRMARAPRAGEKKPVYERLASSIEGFVPMQGLAFILRNKTLRILTMVMAVEVFLIDALPFVLLPNLITDAFGAHPTALPSWMPGFLSGPILTQVATAGGVLGLLFSIEYIGRFLSSARLESEKGDRLIEKWGHARFYKMAAVASLSFWLLYLVPMVLAPGAFWVNLAVTAAVLFGVQLFHAPVGIVMEPVKRKQMPDDMLARIESAVFMVDVAFESIGALVLGLTLDFLGLKTALIATGVALTLTALLQWKVPSWIGLPGPKKDAPQPPKPDDGGAQASLAPTALAFA